MDIHLLKSPTGGTAASRETLAQFLVEVRSAGHAVVDLTAETAEESSANLGSAVANGRIERLLVAGGDGLVNLAIQHVAGTSIPVTLAPSGTGNDFASALGVNTQNPADFDAPVIDIDLIHLTDESDLDAWVASIVIAGFPATINGRANRLPRFLGTQVYTIATLLELPGFSRTEIALRLDGEPLTSDTAMMAIGNTKLFGGGMVACPEALPTDGLLHLTLIEGVGRIGLLPHLTDHSGASARRPEVLRRTATKIHVDTPGMQLWGDGEPIAESPVLLTIVPGALRVTGARTT